MSWQGWERWIQERTEVYLTWRRRRRRARKEKQKRRNPVVDWLDAILSAVVIVLLINQYVLQAYQIPSESMVPTLEISDRIFVNKLVYGPELIPGMLKLPGFRHARRGEVIIFESPDYVSVGPAREILQRVVYMVTLSLVDINRDENGQPKKQFLVKRAIGLPGDRIRTRDGNVQIMTPNSGVWTPEAELQKDLGLSYPVLRSFAADQYPALRSAGVALALAHHNLPVSAAQEADIAKFGKVTRDNQGNYTGYVRTALYDDIELLRSQFREESAIDPTNAITALTWRAYEEGTWIPQNRLFPMGDNRDNSADARYFGPVRLAKVLGKGLFRYWPFSRLGAVR